MGYGNTMELDDLLAMNESPKLDFKIIWKPEDLKGELIKDILSLANGNPHTVGEEGLLIFGISDNKKNIRDMTDEMLLIPNTYRDLTALETTILNTLNDHVTPDFLGLKLKFIPSEQGRILVITIPSHPYLLSLSKDLQLPANKGKTRTDKENTTYYRIGDVIHSNSRKVIEAFNNTVAIKQPFSHHESALTQESSQIAA